MPHKFTFDISKAPQHFFIELASIANQMGLQKVFSKTLKILIRKFRIQDVSGLDIQDAVVLIQNLLEMQTLNLIQKQQFQQTKKSGYSFPTVVENTWIVNPKLFSSQACPLTSEHTALSTVMLTKQNALPKKKSTAFTFYQEGLVCLIF